MTVTMPMFMGSRIALHEQELTGARPGPWIKACMQPLLLLTAIIGLSLGILSSGCSTPITDLGPCPDGCPPGTTCNPDTNACETPLPTPVQPKDTGRSMAMSYTNDGSHLLVASYSSDLAGVVLSVYQTTSTSTSATAAKAAKADNTDTPALKAITPEFTFHVDGSPTTPAGYWLDMAICPENGSVWLAYTWYSTTSSDQVRVATTAGGNPSARWVVETADMGSGRGEYISLALGSNCTPHLAYHDSRIGSLRYGYRTGPGKWQSTTIDGPDENFPDRRPVGRYASLTVVGDRPVIAYHDGFKGNLMVASHDLNGWTRSIIDGTNPFTGLKNGDCGMWASVATDNLDNIAVAYHESTRGELRYAWNDKGVLRIEVVDDGWAKDYHSSGEPLDKRSVGLYAALAIDQNRTPTIAYMDGSTQELKLAARNGEGGTWTIKTLTGGDDNRGAKLDEIQEASAAAGFWATIALPAQGSTDATQSSAMVGHCLLQHDPVTLGRTGAVEVLIP